MQLPSLRRGGGRAGQCNVTAVGCMALAMNSCLLAMPNMQCGGPSKGLKTAVVRAAETKNKQPCEAATLHLHSAAAWAVPPQCIRDTQQLKQPALTPAI